MNPIDEKVIQILGGLALVCRDEQQAFHAAAESLPASDLRELLEECAAERGEYVRELHAQVFALGGSVERSAFGESLHRSWMNLKSVVAPKDPVAVLAVCERGGEAARKAYREALKAELDPETRALISRQSRGVAAACTELGQWRHRIAATGTGSPFQVG